SSWRKQPEVALRLTDAQTTRVVEVESHHESASTWCLPHHTIPLPGEMIVPGLGAGVVEGHRRPTLRIFHLRATRLVQVAARARKREVLQDGRPAVAPRGDVLGVECSALERLVHAAVFTPMPRSLCHLLHSLRPGAHGARPSRRNAWPFSNDIVSLNSTSA